MEDKIEFLFTVLSCDAMWPIPDQNPITPGMIK